MEEQYPENSITGYIKSVRSQMSKISSAYEESDTPLNQFLQAKYEKKKMSPYGSNNSFSNAYENSFCKEDKEDFNLTRGKIFRQNEGKKIDLNERNFELESRVAELVKIQDSLMKSLEENKKKALQAEQYDKKIIIELKEKLSFAHTKILNLEEALQSGDREKMRKYIKELEICKETLKSENANLIYKMQEINKDLELIEIQSHSMSDELHALKQQNSSMHSELVSIKSEKVDLLKQIDHLTSSFSMKDSQVNELASRLEDLKSLIQSTSFQKFSDLSSFGKNSQLETLTKENETLRNLVSQKPNFDIQTAKKKIDKLEKVVDGLNTSNNDRSKSCEKKTSLASQNRILRELTNELGGSPFNLLETFKKVSKENKILLKSQEFISKLKKLLTQSGVPDFPSQKQLWKWLKSILTDYFILKKHVQESESALKNYTKIKSMLNTDSEDIPGQVSRLLFETEYLKLLINKTKVVLRLNRKLSLQDFEQELDHRL